MKSYLFLLIILIIWQNKVEACSLVERPTIVKPDSSEYFFEGQVIGYVKTEMIFGLKRGQDTWGWQIAVTNAIHTPIRIDTVEVYGFGMDRCKSVPRSLEKLKEWDILGKKVKVIAVPYNESSGSDPMQLHTGSGFSYRGVFTRIDQTLRYTHYKYNPVRMKEVMFLVDKASAEEVEMRVQLLADAREYWSGKQIYWHHPEREKECKGDSLEYFRKEATLLEDVPYYRILRRYLIPEKEKTLLAEELERRELPSIPFYLDLEPEEVVTSIREVLQFMDEVERNGGDRC